jgi:lipooligosaccharide transport system permease protein
VEHFFPLSQLPDIARIVALATLPLTHVVNLVRGSVLGMVDATYLLIGIAWISIATLIFFVLSINLMKKRLIK